MKRNKAIRILNVAQTGARKRFLLRGIADRSAKNAVCVFNSDVKGEMISSNKPVQEQFSKLLGKDDICQMFQNNVGKT